MKKKILLGLIALALSFSATVSGVVIPDSISAEEEKLVFIGAGPRHKFGFKVYVSSLFLKAKKGTATEIRNGDEAMAIRLDITSNMINSKNMTEAIYDGFNKSLNGNIAPVETEIKQALEVFSEKIVSGDYFEFVYIPKKGGVELRKNGKPFRVIKGIMFKKALFGIWMGEVPPQKGLREQMLGITQA